MGCWRGLVLFWALSGCGDSTPDACADPEPSLAAGLRARVIEPYCLSCHDSQQVGAERRGAPVGLDFDTDASLAPVALSVANAITAGTMPPSGEPRPGPEERALAEAWRRCGFPP